MVVKVASAATLYQQHQQQHLQQQSPNDIESSADEPSTEEPEHTEGDTDIEKMRAKLQQLQHEQQQQYLRQQQHQLQLHLQQMQATQGAGVGAGGGETAYLLERADSNIAPIYGTWRTKAQRQQHAISSHEPDDAHVSDFHGQCVFLISLSFPHAWEHEFAEQLIYLSVVGRFAFAAKLY